MKNYKLINNRFKEEVDEYLMLDNCPCVGDTILSSSHEYLVTKVVHVYDKTHTLLMVDCMSVILVEDLNSILRDF